MMAVMDRANLLGTDEASLAWRRALCELAHQLYDATLVGNPAPKVSRIHERLSEPEVGDYVYEDSTFWRGTFESGCPIVAEGNGFLAKVADEPFCTDEQWEAYKREDPELTDEDRLSGTERVYYIQYGPNDEDVCRWTNCSFKVVPLDPGIFAHPPAGHREGKATVITRGSLLGSLADSGFELNIPSAVADETAASTPKASHD